MKAVLVKGHAGARKPPKVGSSFVLAPVVRDGIRRIRIQREVVPQGLYRGEQLLIERNYYLDGLYEQTSHIGEYRTQSRLENRIIMEPAAVPIRTKDVTDFGRLETAVKTLVGQMQAYDSEKDGSGEQMESFLRSYQTILEWQRRAQERLTQAEGQIDLAGALLRKTMGL